MTWMWIAVVGLAISAVLYFRSIDDQPLGWGAAVGILMIGLVIQVLWSDVQDQKAFLAECERDHKHYECTAMWRAGEPSTVPVFIPVYH